MRNKILCNKSEIEQRIGEAKARGGFSHDVRIVAVTKYRTIEDTNAAIEGHLQTNKVKALLSMKDLEMIQSVDSVHLAGEIDKYSEKLGRTTQILLQVNIGDESQKFGVDPADTVALVRDVSGFGHLKIKGLMATMPIEKDIKLYKEFKDLFEKVKSLNVPGTDMQYLSMGMSNDFEEAVECGSNMVRIGTALFK